MKGRGLTGATRAAWRCASNGSCLESLTNWPNLDVLQYGAKPKMLLIISFAPTYEFNDSQSQMVSILGSLSLAEDIERNLTFFEEEPPWANTFDATRHRQGECDLTAERQLSFQPPTAKEKY